MRTMSRCVAAYDAPRQQGCQRLEPLKLLLGKRRIRSVRVGKVGEGAGQMHQRFILQR